MQKKLIAVAIAAISAAPAFAQSNVTVYGRVDYGWMSRGGDDGAVNTNGTKDEMASGMQAGSRIGFKGSEDLGNGLKAIFEIEQGLQSDSSATTGSGVFSTLNRHSYVGLTGNFGTVVGGRLDGVRYGIYNTYDAFAGGGMGNFTQMTLQVDRADNAIAYISPNWSGFSFVAAHARSVAGQEVTGGVNLVGGVAPAPQANTGDGRLYTINGKYSNGPISLDLDYETVIVENSNTAASGDTVVWTVAGSYDFGMVKVRALYDHHDKDTAGILRTATNKNAVDYDAWFVSATMPYGNFLFKATYGQISDDRNATERGVGLQGDATKWGIGMNYNLSKRTNVYLDYASISNDRNANYQIAPAANTQGTGYGTNGFNMGLAHNF
ncbi:MAG: porin [Betaproteobacteria bacterium]|nr:porin [Betaproteobacteria bacterium]